MCGIVGIHSLGAPRPVDRRLLEEMNRVITHRGPDSDGFYEDPGRVGLAMRRLSIIDLAGGDQPITNEDGSVWIVFNGEIYNFQSLRRELESHGHTFKTHSDTETIVHAYEEWGDAGVERLRGMFAFALWDAKRQRLLLARDRVGIKQLFYTVQDGQLFWGSELKAVLRCPHLERRVSAPAVNHYLTYLYVPAPLTIFEDIYELEAGHTLVAEGGEITTRKYWDLDYAVDESLTIEAAARGLRYQLDDAVKVRMIADVPLGGFLSGGIDSGSIVALMAKHASKPVETFSIGYDAGGEHFDERPVARRVAERYGTRHHEFVVEPDVAGLVPDLVRAFDQPFADSSAIPNWYLASMTRQHVTVALSGLGGDEVAAGYERYRGALLAERFAWFPSAWRRHMLEPLIERLPDSSSGGHWMGRAKRFVRTLSMPLDERYLALISAFGPTERHALLSPAMREEIDRQAPRATYQRYAERAAGAAPLNQVLYADLKLYLPGDLLTLTDRMSMAHSLEVRVPFLDHHLLEYAATIPPAYKLRGMERKYVLKRAVEDLLPREFLDRKKMGFSVPLTVWFRGVLRDYVEEVLSERSLRLAGVFDPPAVRAVVDAHLARRANYDNHIWALLCFGLWHRDYIETADGLGERPCRAAGGIG